MKNLLLNYIIKIIIVILLKIHKIIGIPPLPRSGSILLPIPENKLLIYGGYSKERIKKDVDKGYIHSDMFLMIPESK